MALALENHTLIVAILNTSYFLVRQRENGMLEGISGRDFNILDTFSKLLGFSYKLVFPKDNAYGILKNGSWTGLIGMLMRDEADFTATSMAMSVDRERAISFTFVCKQDYFIYVTKKLAGFSWTSSYFFAKPFQRRVWLLLGLFVLSTLLLLPSIRFCFPKHKNLLKTFTLWNVLAIMMCISNPRRLVSSDAHGLAVATLIVLLGSILKIYGSTLASSVNTSEFQAPIDTIKDLAHAVKSGNLSVGIVKGHDIIQVILKNSKREELQVLSRYMEDSGLENQLPFPLAYRAILETNFALIVGVQTFVKLMNTFQYSLRNVHIPSETLLKNSKAMAYGASFRHKAKFNKVLRRILTYGLIDKWEAMETFKLERDLAKSSSSSNVNFIDMRDMVYIFAALLIAYCLVTFVLITEMLFYFIFYRKK